MAVEYMTAVDPYNTQKDIIGYEYDSGDVAAAGNGNWIIIPDNIRSVNAVLEITAGEGKLQTTKNKIADVIAGTDIVAIDWKLGSVIATAEDEHTGRVTAIRMVNISGTTRMLLNA